MRSAV